MQYQKPSALRLDVPRKVGQNPEGQLLLVWCELIVSSDGACSLQEGRYRKPNRRLCSHHFDWYDPACRSFVVMPLPLVEPLNQCRSFSGGTAGRLMSAHVSRRSTNLGFEKRQVDYRYVERPDQVDVFDACSRAAGRDLTGSLATELRPWVHRRSGLSVPYAPALQS